ncbi:hypothetical protein L1987_37708 [Smallanthus sonchifolius]|uniref:Uncharacterized protein n=1 Tax=Smallanthus sonchifolius TaxID=185202 RepID=A0ACB9HH38_9ASTR|nr:hypothetical protein L1987_37708 [Smallanthus sonchifolius]
MGFTIDTVFLAKESHEASVDSSNYSGADLAWRQGISNFVSEPTHVFIGCRQFLPRYYVVAANLTFTQLPIFYLPYIV